MGCVILAEARLVVGDLTPQQAATFEGGASWTIDDLDAGARYVGCRVTERSEFAGKVSLWFAFAGKSPIPAEPGVEVSFGQFRPEAGTFLSRRFPADAEPPPK